MLVPRRTYKLGRRLLPNKEGMFTSTFMDGLVYGMVKFALAVAGLFCFPLPGSCLTEFCTPFPSSYQDFASVKD